MSPNSPIRPTDDDARALARRLIETARFGALGVSDPASGNPMVTRIAVATDVAGAPLALISDLSAHTSALRSSPHCSLLLGEPGEKGDPLSHPRVTLQCRARFISTTDTGRAALRETYLAQHPKAKLYADFADFCFVKFEIEAAYLNGGFGQAYHLTARDIAD